MTENEALEIIKRKSSIPMDNETFDEIEEAYDIAIEALEKQIPKKPDIEKFWGYDDLMCPNCKGYKIRKPNYCSSCGQHLDWE